MMRWLLPFALTTMVISVIWSLPAPEYAWRAIVPANRADMAWVQRQVPPGARFAVVSGDARGNEGTDEWFPSLTNAVSVSTPQGAEWTGRGRWQEISDAHAGLQACASQDISCLDRWSVSTGISFNYVYLPKGNMRGPLSPDDCCTALRASLLASTRARLLLDDHGASIWAFQPLP
jgi:hypothetical protein